MAGKSYVRKERNWKLLVCVCVQRNPSATTADISEPAVRTTKASWVYRNSGCSWKVKMVVSSLNTKIRNESFKIAHVRVMF
jgi:hypothetical protein